MLLGHLADRANSAHGKSARSVLICRQKRQKLLEFAGWAALYLIHGADIDGKRVAQRRFGPLDDYFPFRFGLCRACPARSQRSGQCSEIGRPTQAEKNTDCPPDR